MNDRPFLILAAAQGEEAPYRNWMEAMQEAPAPRGIEVVKGYLAKLPVLLARGGVGKTRMARLVQHAVERHGPFRAAILSGAAGALDLQLMPGDVVVGERAVAHDRLWVAASGELPMHIMGFDGAGDRAALSGIAADPTLLDLARAAAERVALLELLSANPQPKVYFGAIATGEQFIARMEKKRWIHEQFGALACNQEGSAAAEVCMLEGIPFLEVRGISDLADEGAEIDPTQVHVYPDQYEAARTIPAAPRYSGITDVLRARLNGAAGNAALLVRQMIELTGEQTG